MKRGAIYVNLLGPKRGHPRHQPTGHRLRGARRAARLDHRRTLRRRDKSAWSGRKPPEYQRMLTDIRNGLIDGCSSTTLTASIASPQSLSNSFRSAIRPVSSCSAPYPADVDLATDDGRFHARILGAVARKESDDKSRRIRRKALELAEGESSAAGAIALSAMSQTGLASAPPRPRS